MATRHELIHIDFVASAGKANPVLDSLKQSCENARLAKERLDEELIDAKSKNAPLDHITAIEEELSKQTKTWKALQKGVREYARGIETLSKGIKEYNSGTLDEMPAKFNKQVYNSAKLAQSSVKTGSDEWNQLQRLMDATDRNVTRAREDIDKMMASINDGSTVSTVQLTRSRDVLDDLSRLAIVNSEEWRGLKDQMGEVAQSIKMVEESERRLKGEIIEVNDALRLSENLSKEASQLRYEKAKGERDAKATERKGIEATMKGIDNKIISRTEERSNLEAEIRYQEIIEKEEETRARRIAAAQKDIADARERRDNAQKVIDDYNRQVEGIKTLSKEVRELTKEREREEKAIEKASKTSDDAISKQHGNVTSLGKEINDLESDLNALNVNVDKLNAKQVKKETDEVKPTGRRKSGLTKKEKEEMASLASANEALELSIKGIKEERDKLSESQNKGAEAAAKDADAIKEEANAMSMSKEEAQAALKKMSQRSIINFKTDGSVDFDDIEEVQRFLFSSMKRHGSYNDKTSTFSIAGTSQFDNVLSDLQNSYKIGKTENNLDKDLAKQVLKSILSRKGVGLVEDSVFIGETKSFSIKRDDRAFGEFRDKQRDLLEISKGLGALTTEQREKLKSLEKAVKDANELLDKRRKEYQDRLDAAENIPGATEINGTKTAKGKAFESAEIYRNSYVQKQKERVEAASQALTDFKESIQQQKATVVEEQKPAPQKEASEDVSKEIALRNEQIAFLENQRDENLKRLEELKKKDAEATDKQAAATQKKTKADKEAAEEEKNMAELLKKKAELEEKLAKKRQKLAEEQKKLNDLESDAAAGSNEKIESLNKLISEKEHQIEEGNERLPELAAAKGKAISERRKASTSIDRSEKEIEEASDRREYVSGHKSEEEVSEMKKRIAELTVEIDKETKAYEENAQAIAKLNKDETDANIEMAQSQNISIEKVKQAIDVLQKKIQTEELDTETMKQYGTAINKLKDRLSEMNADVTKLSEPIANRLSGNLDNMSETEIKNAIDAGQQLIKTYKSASPEAKALAENIARAEEHLKKTGVESARQAQREAESIALMQNQLGKGGSLTESALKTQIQYWQRLADDPRTAAESVEVYKENVKQATELLKVMNASNNKETAKKLLAGTDAMSEGELREAIAAAKEYQQTISLGNEEHSKYSVAIAQAEEKLKKYGAEAERQKIREAESISLMQNQLDKGDLTESALKAQIQYWQKLADAPNAATESVKVYKDNIEQATELLKVMNASNNKETAKKLLDGTEAMSEGELREAIAAAKEYQQTISLGNEEHSKYSQAIASAEVYLKKFGLEAARQAQSEAESVRLMQEQLDKGSSLTESAIKSQERYWRKMADSPKATNEQIAFYISNLETVKKLQEDAITERGQIALFKAQGGGYGDANMSEISQAIKDIKEYQALIKDPEGANKGIFDAAKKHVDELTIRLNRLKKATEDVKTVFKDSDEVIARFNEHMSLSIGGSMSGTATSFDEMLNASKSSYDEEIRNITNSIEAYNEQIEIKEKELKTKEERLATLEKKHKNSSWLRKRTKSYTREGWEIEDLQEEIGVVNEDVIGGGFGIKGDLSYYKEGRDYLQKELDLLKQKKAQELGINEVIGQRSDIRRMTREEMQEGIKMLETEAFSQDRSTAEGQQRFETLRLTIDKMKQEIKESTGEWMAFAEAEKIASLAGTDGFVATSQQMQQATQAIERQRDALVKSIQQKRTKGSLTDEDKGAIAREEKELSRLEVMLKKLKFEQDNFNMSHKKMVELLRQPKSATDIEELKSAIKRADGELRNMKNSLGDGNKAYKEFSKQVKEAKLQLKNMEGQAKATNSTWDQAVSRLKSYIGVYLSFNIAQQKIVSTMGDLMKLSDKMGEVRKTTGFTTEEVGRLSDKLAKMDTRTSLQDLMAVSAKAGQLGLKTEEDVLGFTEAANKLMVALPEMGEEASTQIMKVALATGEVDKIRKQMEEGLVEGSSATAVAMEKIGSTINKLRASSAASAPQITDFVKRVGAVGAQSGITIDQVAALGSTVDSLGMRVEMSATALSRMIPAIKNNSFEIAKAIGMAPSTLNDMFNEAGGGMNAMLAIFQHIKDSGMNADSIEKMLGMGGMGDIMKDLNQQGARAGIVFAGLSQNVDTLREHLSIARNAYDENMAIQEEYMKMNETTAAKWERLVNHIEEVFVSSSANNFLGVIIDGLRVIVDILTGPLSTSIIGLLGVFAAIKTNVTFGLAKVLEYLGALKDGTKMATETAAKAAEAVDGVEESLDKAKEVGEEAGEAVDAAKGAIKGMDGAAKASIFSINGMKTAWKGLNATMKLNIFITVVTLLYTLGKALYDAMTKTSKFSDMISEANAKIQIALERLEGYWDKIKDTAKSLESARNTLSKMKEGSEGLTKATIQATKAENDHRAAIAEFNSIYGKYLGFMLSEANYANLNAAAHDKVTAAIRREMLAKQEQEAIDQVSQEHTEKLKEGMSKLTEELRDVGGLSSKEIAKVKIDLQKFIRKNFEYDVNSGVVKVGNSAYSYLENKGITHNRIKKLDTETLMAAWLYEYLKENFHLNIQKISDISGVTKGKQSYYKDIRLFDNNFRKDYASSYVSYMIDMGQAKDTFKASMDVEKDNEIVANLDIVKKLREQAQKAYNTITNKDTTEKERNAAYEDLANSLNGIDNNIGQLNPASDRKLIESLKAFAEKISKNVDSDKLIKARATAASLFSRATGGMSDTSTTETTTSTVKNPWGEKHDAASTDWKSMTAEVLVSRRKQMKDYVNSIQTDTDIEAVLEKDSALMKAIANGLKKDTRSVIEWYNNERLKIQEELHSRHLTNTGDWLDPKKEKARKKRLQEDWNAYINEIDAYYTERNKRIQESQNEEGLSEAETQNRILANEAEWRQRRAELQRIYADKSEEVTREEQEAIFNIIAERTDEEADFVEKTIGQTVNFMKKIGEQSKSELMNALGKLDKGAEADFLKQQQAIGKHLNAIKDIIDKERPFNGIIDSLQQNLTTMGIFTAHMSKEYADLMRENSDMTDFNKRQAEEGFKELTFLIGEAGTAYSSTAEDVMRRAAQQGLTAWVNELRANPQMQEGLMAQLRSTYDSIQEAIKKEASLLKKTAEIQWNNIIMPDGNTMKQSFEETLSKISLAQGRVSRANSLIGTGSASERVVDKLAIKQIQLQLSMQKAYYDLIQKRGMEQVETLKKQSEELREQGRLHEAILKAKDAENVKEALNVAMQNETNDLAKLREELAEKVEESQHRLYKDLRSWTDLLAQSLQEIFEASNEGNAEYYNELAKLNLTGEGGPGAGTYIVIDDAGTSDATAHYEYLDERAALDRQHQIEQDNAVADAWKKVLDDINQKLSDTITDQLNAMLQNSSLDANTQAIIANTQAINANTQREVGGGGVTNTTTTVIGTTSTGGASAPIESGFGVGADGVPESLRRPEDGSGYTEVVKPIWQMSDDELAQNQEKIGAVWNAYKEYGIAAETEKAEALSELPGYTPSPLAITDDQIEANGEVLRTLSQQDIDASNEATKVKIANQGMVKKTEEQTDKQIVKTSQQSFAAMTAAANMYGIAYQVMSNDNLDTSQKVQMMIVQAVGSALTTMLTAQLAASQGATAAESPSWISKTLSQMGPIAGPVAIGVFTALIGGLMGIAVSKIAKSKSQIAQATGTSSASAGRISTGMLTYAEGNVNEFTDPSSLTPGRHYNVDGADGKTYRAKYTGSAPRTHITTGPEFHLVGEAGREAIIDAKTTRKIQMNDNGIWRAIQTLYNGGSISRIRGTRRGRGVPAFAEGNLDYFDETGGYMISNSITTDMSQVTSLKASIDRQSELLEDLRVNGIKATFDVYGKGGLIDSYDTGKKTVNRHGERY